MILRGLGRALGPSAKATSKDYRALHYVRDTPWTGPGPRSFRKSDNSNCQKTVRTSCPTLRVMYELPINIPVSYTSLGLHVLHAGYTSEVGYGRVGELALLTLTGDSSFPRGPAKSRSRGHPKQPESEVKRRSGAPCSHCAASALANSPPSFTRAPLSRSGKIYKFPCHDSRQPAAASRQRTHMHARRASLQARVEPQREQQSANCVKAAKMAP